MASYVLETDKGRKGSGPGGTGARHLPAHDARYWGGASTGAVDLTLLGMSRDSGKMFPLDERVRVDVGAKAAGGWMSLTP